MTDGHRSPLYDEVPVVFPADQEEIYGIFVQPRRAPSNVGVVLLNGGGFIAMTHRNRMWVHLARGLAERGFPVLRFDYHGVGESTGDIPELWLDGPFVEDLKGAVDWLRGRGLTRLVFVGSCFGARTIIATAPNLQEAEGAVLLSMPPGSARLGELAAERFAAEFTMADYVRRAARWRVIGRLFDAKWRDAYRRVAQAKLRKLIAPRADGAARGGDHAPALVSRRFLRDMREVSRRRLPTLMVYGDAEGHYHDIQRAMDSEFGRIVREAGDAIEIRTVPGVLHGFTTMEMQQTAVTQTLEWICARHGSPAPLAGAR